MAGVYTLIAPCCGCGKTFTSNPHSVPSIGRKFPICRCCIDRINAKRIEKGLEPVYVPEDAYEPTEAL